jgi:hypothetical protein
LRPRAQPVQSVWGDELSTESESVRMVRREG